MKQMDLPMKFQQDVQYFLIQTQGTKSEQNQLKEFLKMISPSLREQVSILIFSKVILKNKRFKSVFTNKQNLVSNSLGFKVDMSEVVQIMISKFITELSEPEDEVVKQFEETNDMFLIAKGQCKVMVTDQKKNVYFLKNVRPGDYFGEISMIYGCKRTASVISTKYSTLAKLS